MEDSDLTSLFCNLLDNAFEAAYLVPDGFLEISTAKNERMPFIIITVINSSRKNSFQTPDGALTTDKSDRRRHGFGLKSVRKTVKKYHGDMQMYYSDDTFTFHTIITLKDRRKSGQP